MKESMNAPSKGLKPIVKPAAAAARWGKGIQEKVVEK